MNDRQDPRPLKDFIDRDAVRRLGRQIQAGNPGFPLDSFVRRASRGLGALEFTARTRHVAQALAAALPAAPDVAMGQLQNALPPPLESGEGMFSENFWLWPISDYVIQHGLAAPRAALALCHALTQCFTAEFALRPLLETRPEATLKALRQWTSDPSEHVRRAVSEATRPRLPWASRLRLERDAVWPLLEALRADPSRYVQKSVANHLNDLGKDDPAWLINAMAAWSAGAPPATGWIVRHALRTQIKAGHPQALAVIGYAAPELTQVSFSLSAATVSVGGRITASFACTSAGATTQPVLLDWILHYYRPGKGGQPKVFKGKTLELAPGETLDISKTFAMEQRATRRLHPGPHRLEVQVNGEVAAGGAFELLS